MRAAGYRPDLVAMSPTDGLELQLISLEGGASYVFAQALPSVVVSNSIADGEGFVCDSSALGTLFLSPFSFGTFEENAGQTNTSTVRGESNGVFVVQRLDAAASILLASP
ncbi:MAG: hypothetical protein ACXWZU_12455 [Actinomycetota bacterium]